MSKPLLQRLTVQKIKRKTSELTLTLDVLNSRIHEKLWIHLPQVKRANHSRSVIEAVSPPETESREILS